MNGGICPKAAAAIASLNDNQRVRFPLIRTGERGSGQWKRVSWTKALDYTADKCKEIFDKYGAKSSIYCERANLISDISKSFQKAIGSPNHFTHDTVCKGSINTACRSIIGYTDGQINADWSNAKHVVPLWPQCFRIRRNQGHEQLHFGPGKGHEADLHRSTGKRLRRPKPPIIK